MVNKSVTMKSIGELLGVSTVTVSKALGDKEGVSEELRAVIKGKADELGYVYSSSKGAGNRRPGTSNIIGVIVASNYVDMSSYSFYLNMYHSVILELAEKGYSGIMEIITDNMRSELIMPTALLENKVDGIIVLGQLSTAYVKKVLSYGKPVTLLDYYDSELETDSVVTDNVLGTYQLTEYCIKKGHSKIAFVGSINATCSILDRYLGYYRALVQNGIKVPEDYVIEDRDENLLNYSEMLLPKEMPTAFVCNCDEVAYLVMDQLKKKGYRVPEDISVVGFDNYTFLDYTSVNLTTVAVDVRMMAKEAVKLLVRQIEKGEKSNTRRVISGRLIIRDSVKDIN